MAPKYHSFQDLPTEVADRLKVRIVEGEQRQYPATPEDATMDERMADHVEAFKNPDYTEEQLASIVDAFTVFNTAVKRGLPNQLYQMMARTLDTEIAQRAHAAGTIWYAHEDDGSMAKEQIQRFVDMVEAEIDKRADWKEEEFHREYFLGE